MMKRTLRTAILAGLGTAALATLSTEVSAMSFHYVDFGTLSGKARKSDNNTVPPAAYTAYGIANQGWFHTAQFYVFTVGTQEEIDAGARYTVTVTMKGRETAEQEQKPTFGPLGDPSFTVWALGTNKFVVPEGTCHGWAQLRGPNDDVANPLKRRPGKLPGGEVVTANNVDNGDKKGIGDGTAEEPTPNGIQDGCLLTVGVVNGHNGWVGYAHSGPDVDVRLFQDPINDNFQTKNRTTVVDQMPQGWFVNWQSPYANGRTSRGKVTDGEPLDSARLTLKGLKAGTYLIGSGGGCGLTNPATDCAPGTSYTMTVVTKPQP